MSSLFPDLIGIRRMGSPLPSNVPVESSSATGLILEGIATTWNAARQTHTAAMGAIFSSTGHLILRPFSGTTTLDNLRQTHTAVFQLTDNIGLLVRAALAPAETEFDVYRETDVLLPILTDACSWFALQVDSLDESQDRAIVRCHITAQGERRPFRGFNRARHSLLELAILATRIQFLSPDIIEQEWSRTSLLVNKTGGPEEFATWDWITAYLRQRRVLA